MLLTCNKLTKILPVIRLEVYNNKDISLTVPTKYLNKVLLLIRNHFNYQFKTLICISGIDYPKNYYRFQIAYEFLSFKFNARLRVKTLVNDLTPVNSIENIFLSAAWWESEIWDMFGLFFINQNNLTRILTDYGFVGFPLRKDFPLSGFVELKYSTIKSRVVYEQIELNQEYRNFDFLCPWDISNYNK